MDNLLNLHKKAVGLEQLRFESRGLVKQTYCFKFRLDLVERSKITQYHFVRGKGIKKSNAHLI